jgi:hypothetical protein
VRRYAAVALGGIRPNEGEVVPGLMKVLKNAGEDDKVRDMAAWAMSRLQPGPAAVAALPDLMAVLKDQATPLIVRTRAMWALRIHDKGLRQHKDIAPALTTILGEPRNEKSKMLHYDVAFTLGAYWGAEAPSQALDALLDFLRDDKVMIYRGTGGKASGSGKEGGGPGDTSVKEEAKGDGRIMAVRALRFVGRAVVTKRADIMGQLQALNASTKDEDLSKELKSALQEFGK